MARPLLRPMPPRGSTDWGALQFYRLLDEEERIAAEREHLRTLGWQHPRSEGGNAPAEAGFRFGGASISTDDDSADASRAYVELIDQERAYRRALDHEARRRVAARAHSAPDRSASNEPSPDWRGGGRFGVSVPGNSEPGPLQHASLLKAATRGESLGKGLIELLKLLGAYGAYEATKPGGRVPNQPDPGRPPEAPADRPSIPGTEPVQPEDLSHPFPNPAPLPDELTEPLPPQIAEEFEKLTKPALPGFQDILDKFWQAGILIRGESESTRQDNEDIIKMVEAEMASCGWSAKHTHGAARKERYIKGDGPGTRGSRYTDGTVEGTAPDGRRTLYDFNTAQQLKDGRWIAYERRAESAIRLLLSKVEDLRTRFDVYPKSRGSDRELWKESVRPYVRDAVRALLDC